MNGDELFWDLAEDLYRDPAVSRSTMMGYPCLRYDGRFFASIERETHRLLVKLPRQRVTQLIDDGDGEPFAPAGRTFREWAAVPRPHRERWEGLLDEAKDYAAGADQHVRGTPAAGTTEGFRGFGAQGLEFLAGLERHNTKAYFDAHRATYRNELLEPAKVFVATLGELLTERVSASVRAQPRIGGSMFRIANDLRFNRDRPPYKTHIDFAFWDGDDGPRSDPALVIRMSPRDVLLGVGVPRLTGERLRRYRAGLCEPGRLVQLDTAVEALISTGAELNAPTRARPPAGIDPTGVAARYAIRDSIYVTHRFAMPDEVTTPAFPEWCAQRFQPFAPLHRWLTTTITGTALDHR